MLAGPEYQHFLLIKDSIGALTHILKQIFKDSKNNELTENLSLSNS